MTLKSIPLATVVAGPANFLALGAGLGLAPRAPGTFGKLLGIPLLYFMPESPGFFFLVLLLLFAVGVWCCHECARSLGVHDHPSIVWDEVVGYLLTMAAMPRTAGWILAGFVVFRVFDIIKPWPIGWVDRHVHGGLGIMLDDVLAGILALLVMQLLLRLF